ncbi:MAG: HEAT repeat domain-containing protein, partial [Leptolyngbyaceae cyanobacterium RM1_406_9]|nr:HEAT repeat domain-containing protein [Leptolyngbyaceae cyanobacterium RM1_406_9]
SKQVIPILLNVIESSDVLVAGDAAKALGQIDSDDTIPALLKALESGNPEVRLIVAYKLSGFKSNCIASILPDLFKLLSTQSGEDAFDAIQGIQVNCKFYNYDLYQAYLAAQKGDPSASQSDKPTNVFNIGTLHAPGAAINLGGTIQGDQIGSQPHPPEL